MYFKLFASIYLLDDIKNLKRVFAHAFMASRSISSEKNLLCAISYLRKFINS